VKRKKKKLKSVFGSGKVVERRAVVPSLGDARPEKVKLNGERACVEKERAVWGHGKDGEKERVFRVAGRPCCIALIRFGASARYPIC
jgi:hypothetical protein